MKIGMVISAFILLLIVGAIYLKSRPKGADAGSGAITAEVLAVQNLPENLPVLGMAAGGDATDAAALLAAAKDADRWVRGGFEDEKKVQESLPLITQVINAGSSPLKAGFIDSTIDSKEFESAANKQAMTTIATAVSLHISYYLEEAQFDQANQLAIAYLQLGRQMFDKNTRLKSRQRGLLIMKKALQEIGKIAKISEEDGEITAEQQKTIATHVMTWFDAIKKVDDAWNAKLKTTESTNSAMNIPNIADLIKIANEDKDLTFRAWAALRLGYARFERGDAGNQAAIDSALGALEKSSDAKVAEAAKAGRAIKDKDEYHQLRK